MIAVGLLSLACATGTAHAQSSAQVSAPVADSGPWHLVNRHSGKCLTVQNVSTADGASTLQWFCEYTSPFNEDWFLDDLSAGDPYFHIVNSHSDKCLTVQNASTADNAVAVQWACDLAAPFNEEWYFVDMSPNTPYYHIVNRHSGKCLTVQGAFLTDGALGVQYACESAAPFNEEWQLVP